jgi:hypothetical protein
MGKIKAWIIGGSWWIMPIEKFQLERIKVQRSLGALNGRIFSAMTVINIKNKNTLAYNPFKSNDRNPSWYGQSANRERFYDYTRLCRFVDAYV